MGIFLKGVSIPTDRDMEIIIHPDGAARVEVKEDYGLHMIGTDAINISEKRNQENWDCYWSYGGEPVGDTKYFTEKYCRFNDEVPHKPCKICSKFVRRDKIDDYIHYLLEEIESLIKEIELMEKLP